MKRLLVGGVLLLISSICLSKDIPLNKEIGLCKNGFSFSCFNVAERLYKGSTKWRTIKAYSKRACFLELSNPSDKSLAELFCWAYFDKLNQQEPDNEVELLEVARGTCDGDPSNTYMCYRAGLLLERDPQYKNSQSLIDRYFDRACYHGKSRGTREFEWKRKACKKLE